MNLERTSVIMQKEILKLREQGYSMRKIALMKGICYRTIKKIYQAQDEGLSPCQKPIHNKLLDALDWDYLRCEITERQTPIKVLWEEEKEKHDLDISYSSFTREVKRRIHTNPNTTLRKIYKPGEFSEVDFCNGIPIYEGNQQKNTQLFVLALPFSSFFYAEFIMTQKTADFLSAYANGFHFFGGVTQYSITDNHKAGVIKAHRYDPKVNQTFQDFANHMGFGVIPARAYKPKDKACVERQIGIIQKQFFAAVRNVIFTSLFELNQALKAYLPQILNTEMKREGCSRMAKFQHEKKFLMPLPHSTFVAAEYKQVKVHADCHIQFKHNFYSVPHELVGEQLKARATGKILELFDNTGNSVATHSLLSDKGNYSTKPAHYPKEQYKLQQYDIQVALQQAKRVGPHTFTFVEKLFANQRPKRNLSRVRGMMSVLRLKNPDDTSKYHAQDMENAALLCLKHHKYNYQYFMDYLKYQRVTQSSAASLSPTRSEDLIHLDNQHNSLAQKGGSYDCRSGA